MKIVDVGGGLTGQSISNCKSPDHRISAVHQHLWLTDNLKGIISPAVNYTAATGICPPNTTLFLG